MSAIPRLQAVQQDVLDPGPLQQAEQPVWEADVLSPPAVRCAPLLYCMVLWLPSRSWATTSAVPAHRRTAWQTATNL